MAVASAWRVVWLGRYTGSTVVRYGSAAARPLLPCSHVMLRTFAHTARHAAKPRRWRQVFGSVFLGGAAISGGWWKLNQSVTPEDAEELALERMKHHQKEIERVEKKLSVWRLVQLLLLTIPVALASPLYLIAPSMFWKIVAMQIDRSGPCFIKLAQWLSTRRDIFSDELCESLSVMHESVEAAWSRGISPKDVESKLRDAGLAIQEMDDVAVASGSIAEVYFAKLEDGTQVAVKCLRPSVSDILEGDLAWLLRMGDAAEKSPRFSMLGIRRAAEEFCEHVQMQVDFQVEASNLKRFRANFADSGEVVRFPAPLFASKEFLVLTWESGDNVAHIFRKADDVAMKRSLAKLASVLTRKLSGTSSLPQQQSLPDLKAHFVTEEEMQLLKGRSADIQEVLGVSARTAKKLSEEVLAAYMRMVFQDAFIHGDLHPGNMMIRLLPGAYAIDAGEGRTAEDAHIGGWKLQIARMLPERFGRLLVDVRPPFELVLIDAGLAIPIAPNRVEALRSMAISMIYCDFKGSATHIYNQSPDSSKCEDPEAFKEALANVFRSVRQNVQEAGYAQVSDACLECLRLVRQHRVQLDTGLSWALFAMLSAEGCARQLDPEADCTAAASRYIVTIPSLFREMGSQKPEIILEMIKEVVYGRQVSS